jgi:hypothetical protein
MVWAQTESGVRVYLGTEVTTAWIQKLDVGTTLSTKW